MLSGRHQLKAMESARRVSIKMMQVVRAANGFLDILAVVRAASAPVKHLRIAQPAF